MTMTSTTHPECRTGEVFVGNANENGFKDIPHLRKRKGTQVLDADGNLIDDPNWFPVFVRVERDE